MKLTRRSFLDEDSYIQICEERNTHLISESPLKERTTGIEFIHKSYYEYFVAKRLHFLILSQPEEMRRVLNCRLILEEPEIINFWIEGWVSHPSDTLIEPFFDIIQNSKSDDSFNIASSNAATLLANIKEPFLGRDLSGTRLISADLEGTILTNVNLSGADLTGANLRNVFLGGCDLRGANLTNVNFGEYPYIQLKEDIETFAIDPTGSILAISPLTGNILLYGLSTQGWEWSFLAELVTFEPYDCAFSPDSKTLCTVGKDNATLWDVEKKTARAILNHPDEFVTHCAFSPNGELIVTAGPSAFYIEKR